VCLWLAATSSWKAVALWVLYQSQAQHGEVITAELLIVAGGGGGDSWKVSARNAPPGYGGGVSGGSSSNCAKTVAVAGGSNLTGYSFGLGQNGYNYRWRYIQYGYL